VFLIAWSQELSKWVWAVIMAYGAILFNSLLKVFLHRPRPDIIEITYKKFNGYSFPSGHTFGSTMVYGLFAYAITGLLSSPWDYLVAGILVLLILLVGISRVYLGAHFPSDVVAGWLLGLAAIAVVLEVVLKLS
jgi:undecaprenyl-diphosphatase